MSCYIHCTWTTVYMFLGLFHNAILISGTDMATWAYNPPWLPPENYTKHVAREIGCPDSPSQAMINCMRTKPAHEVSRVSIGSIVS